MNLIIPVCPECGAKNVSGGHVMAHAKKGQPLELSQRERLRRKKSLAIARESRHVTKPA
jgi:hypothetical protein